MKIGRLILFGILIWIIPFIIGFIFYDAEGNLAVDIFLFKSVMIVILTSVCCIFSILYLKKIDHNNAHRSVIASGVLWFFIPLLMDVVILIPMAEMTGVDYTYQIGLRYLIIPIIVFTNGVVFSSIRKLIGKSKPLPINQELVVK